MLQVYQVEGPGTSVELPILTTHLHRGVNGSCEVICTEEWVVLPTCWNGINDVRVENVADPKIINPRDCIVRNTLTAICLSLDEAPHGYHIFKNKLDNCVKVMMTP